MITIRDRIWLYCAVPDAYNTARYALPGVNTVKPWDACRSLGLKKAVMDVTLRGPEYPFDPISEKLSFLDVGENGYYHVLYNDMEGYV